MRKHLATSTLLTKLAQPLLQRDDVVVFVDETIDDPAQFHLRTAQILIRQPEFDDAGNPTLGTLGQLAHEAAHANHTPFRRAAPDVLEWAALLEEPRIERLMLLERPDLREALETSAAAVVTGGVVAEKVEALTQLVLIGGRVDAGVFAAAKREELYRRIEGWLQPHLIGEVEELVARAVFTPDDGPWLLEDAERLARIAWGWARGPQGPTCRMLGATEPVPVFRSKKPAPVPEKRVRDATAEEWAAVRRLHGWFANSDLGEHPTTRAVSVPPGSVRMRELVRAASQQEMGLNVSAKPWQRRRRTGAGTESFEMGLIVDRSSSMIDNLEAVAVTAWTLQRSMAGTGSRIRTWAFADDVEVLEVQEPEKIMIPGFGSYTTALAAAVEEYQQWSTGGARVLVIISDGALKGDSALPALEALCRAGVRIVGLAPEMRYRLELAAQLPSNASVRVFGRDTLGQVAEWLAV